MDPSHPYPYYVTDPPVTGLDAGPGSRSGLSHLSAAIQQQEHQRQGYYAPPPGGSPSQLPIKHDPPDPRSVVLERRPSVSTASVGGRVAKVAPMPPIVPSPSSTASSPSTRLGPGSSPTLSPEEAQPNSPLPSRLTTSPTVKKLSPAEIQRIRINQASEYYRKQREAQNERDRLRVVEQEQKQREIQLEQQRILERRRTSNPHPVSNHSSHHPTQQWTGAPSSTGLMKPSAAEMHISPGPVTIQREGGEGMGYGGYQASGFHTTNAPQPYQNSTYGGHTSHTSNPPHHPAMMATGVTSQTSRNIDLGAVVQSTIVNNVSKEFTQHWIIVGQDMRTLLLDFNGSFTLLIPNVENGQAFRVNSTSMEIQSRSLSNGQKLTFMKFQFRDPPTEIVAPVLQDKNMGYKVLKQNSACVFIGRILDEIRPNAQVPSSVSSSSSHGSGSLQSAPLALLTPPAPPPSRLSPSQFSSTSLNNLGPMIRQVSETVYGGHEAELLIAPPPQQLHFKPQTDEPQENSFPFYPEPTKVITLPNVTLNEKINPVDLGPPKPSMPLWHGNPNLKDVMAESPHPPMVSSQLQNPSSVAPQSQHSSPLQTVVSSSTSHECHQQSAKMILSPKTPPSATSTLFDQTNPLESSNSVFSASENRPKPVRSADLANVYPALKDEERQKLTRCRFCERTFVFVSELLVHMKIHVLDVSKVAEMSLKTWVQGRRLKCDVCKNKTSYTLDYAKHKDDHPILGLTCSRCSIHIKSPLELAMHMEKDHPIQIFEVKSQGKTGTSETSEATENNFKNSHPDPLNKSDLVKEKGTNGSSDFPRNLEQPPKTGFPPKICVNPCHALSPVGTNLSSPSHSIALIPSTSSCASKWEQSPIQDRQEEPPLQSLHVMATHSLSIEPPDTQRSTEINSKMSETTINAHQDEDLEDNRIIDDLAKHLCEEVLEQPLPGSTPAQPTVFPDVNYSHKIMAETHCFPEKNPLTSQSSIGPKEIEVKTLSSVMPNNSSVDSAEISDLDEKSNHPMSNMHPLGSSLSQFHEIDSDLPDFNSVIRESCQGPLTVRTMPHKDPHLLGKVEDLINYEEAEITPETTSALMTPSAPEASLATVTSLTTETSLTWTTSGAEAPLATGTSSTTETSSTWTTSVAEAPLATVTSSTTETSSTWTTSVTTEDEDFELKLSEDSDSDNEPPERHVCEICGDEFATPTSLKIHRTKCKNNDERLQCSVCLDCFMSTTSLNMHLTMCKKKMKMKTLGVGDDSVLPTPLPIPATSFIHQKEKDDLKQRDLEEDQDPSIEKTPAVIAREDQGEKYKLFSSQGPARLFPASPYPPLPPLPSPSPPPLHPSSQPLGAFPFPSLNAKTTTGPTQSSFLDSICKIGKKLPSEDPEVVRPVVVNIREKKSAKVKKKMGKHHPKSMLKNNTPLSLTSSISPLKDDTLAVSKDAILKDHGDEENTRFQDLNYDTVLFENSQGIKLRLKKQPVGDKGSVPSSVESAKNARKNSTFPIEKEKPCPQSEFIPTSEPKSKSKLKLVSKKKHLCNEITSTPRNETKKTVAPLKLSILMRKNSTLAAQEANTPKEEPLKLRISLKRPSGYSEPSVTPHKLRIRSQASQSTVAPMKLKISKSSGTKQTATNLSHQPPPSAHKPLNSVVPPILAKSYATTPENPTRIPKLVLRTSSIPGKDSFSPLKSSSVSDLEEIPNFRSPYSTMVHIRKDRCGRLNRSTKPKRVDSLANHLLALSCQVRLHPVMLEHVSPREVHPSQLKNVFHLCPKDLSLLEKNSNSAQPVKPKHGSSPFSGPKRSLVKRSKMSDQTVWRDKTPASDSPDGQPLSSLLATIECKNPTSSTCDESSQSNLNSLRNVYRTDEYSAACFRLNNECDGGVDGDVSSNENDDMCSESVTTRLFSAFKVISSLEETREIVQDLLYDLVGQISFDSQSTQSPAPASTPSNTTKFECFRVPSGTSNINVKRPPLKRSGSGLDRSDYTKRRKRRRKLVDKLIIRTLRSPSTSTDEDSNNDHPDSTKKVCSGILNDLVSTVVAREPRMIIPALILKRPPIAKKNPIEDNKIVPPLKIKLSENASTSKSTSPSCVKPNASVIEITSNHSMARRKGPPPPTPFTTKMTRPNNRGPNKSNGSTKLTSPGPKSVKIKKLLKITNKPLPPVSSLIQDAQEREVIAKAIDEIAQMDMDSPQRPHSHFDAKLERVPIKKPLLSPTNVISDDSTKRLKTWPTKREMWICDTDQRSLSPISVSVSPPVFAKKSRACPSMSPAPHRICLPVQPSTTSQTPFVARKSGLPPSALSPTHPYEEASDESSSERAVSEILWSKESFGLNPEAYSVIDHLFESEVQKLASSIASSSEEPEAEVESESQPESESLPESSLDPASAKDWVTKILLDLISNIVDRGVEPVSVPVQTEAFETRIKSIILDVADEAVFRSKTRPIDIQELSNYKLAKKYSDFRCLPQEFNYDSDLGRSEAVSSEADESQREITCNNQPLFVVWKETNPSPSAIPPTNVESSNGTSALSKSLTSPPKKKGPSGSSGAFSRKSYVKRRRKRSNQAASKAPFDQLISNTRRKYGMVKVQQQPSPPPTPTPTLPSTTTVMTTDSDTSSNMITDEFLLLDCSEDSSNCSLYDDPAKSTPSPTPSLTFDPPGMFVDDEFSPVNSNSETKESDFDDEDQIEGQKRAQYQNSPTTKKPLLKNVFVPSHPIQTRMKKRTLRGSTKL
ncbi:hypothetical protein TCAL_14770 [Tigriopus californicus]|uniref:C2H2-type domain-containing protein n=1 Tax=Tigriopus californicus TaxID=6832 RepID=A0A553PI71_TIGCA|nr:hypothetical protein TCAL_14770 [Tigriopus californicus]